MKYIKQFFVDIKSALFGDIEQEKSAWHLNHQIEGICSGNCEDNEEYQQKFG